MPLAGILEITGAAAFGYLLIWGLPKLIIWAGSRKDRT